jgi:hypothetical protein
MLRLKILLATLLVSTTQGDKWVKSKVHQTVIQCGQLICKEFEFQYK